MVSYESTFNSLASAAELLDNFEVADQVRIILEEIPTAVRFLAQKVSSESANTIES